MLIERCRAYLPLTFNGGQLFLKIINERVMINYYYSSTLQQHLQLFVSVHFPSQQFVLLNKSHGWLCNRCPPPLYFNDLWLAVLLNYEKFEKPSAKTVSGISSLGPVLYSICIVKANKILWYPSDCLMWLLLSNKIITILIK